MRMVRCNYFNCLYFFLAVRLLSVQSEQAMNDNNIQIEGNPKPASGPKRGEQRALKHGLTPLKKAVNTLGNRALDKRTMAGKAFAGGARTRCRISARHPDQQAQEVYHPCRATAPVFGRCLEPIHGPTGFGTSNKVNKLK